MAPSLPVTMPLKQALPKNLSILNRFLKPPDGELCNGGADERARQPHGPTESRDRFRLTGMSLTVTLVEVAPP